MSDEELLEIIRTGKDYRYELGRKCALNLLREKNRKLIEFFLFRGGPSQGVQWFGGFRDTVMAYEAAVKAGLTISL